MNPPQKHAWRIACSIHETLISQARAGRGVDLPSDHWTAIQRVLRKCAQASHRGWNAARQTLVEDALRRLEALRYQIDGVITELRHVRDRRVVPIVSTIYREIQSIGDEFADVECDARMREIRVTTEPIVLDGTYLGPFQICLDVGRLGQPSPYRVVALDPRPAASNESTTHPHVQDETLCEGEGRTAIQAALTSGRIGDFFLIVSQVLATYARGEAYVELRDWEGTPCCDCGSLVSEDDRADCDRCGDVLCGDCAVMCLDCEAPFCSHCLHPCAVCDAGYCNSCLSRCASCDQRACSSCIRDDLCDHCQHEEISNHEYETACKAAR